jgi:cell wall assembly regulator SMI1
MSSEQVPIHDQQMPNHARMVGEGLSLEEMQKEKKSWRGMCTFFDAFLARRDCQQLWLHHRDFSSASRHEHDLPS